MIPRGNRCRVWFLKRFVSISALYAFFLEFVSFWNVDLYHVGVVGQHGQWYHCPKNHLSDLRSPNPPWKSSGCPPTGNGGNTRPSLPFKTSAKKGRMASKGSQTLAEKLEFASLEMASRRFSAMRQFHRID